MSEYVMHVAISDDCASLALYSPAVCAAFKAAIRDHPDAMRLGATTRKFSPQAVLEEAKRQWPAGRAAERIACALGRITHLAADAHFKPIFKRFGERVGSGSWASMYEDLFAYREVYDQGRREPFAMGAMDPDCQSLPAAQALHVGELEPVLLGAYARHVVRLQSALAAANWTELAPKLWQDDDRITLADYCDHYATRRADLEKKYLESINFYSSEDAIIRLARSIQAGKPDATIGLEQAVQSARSGSHWAQTVAGGYLGIVAASRAFAAPGRSGAGPTPKSGRKNTAGQGGHD